MPEWFAGKVAIVTGAASGIGRAVAQLYASHGARVVVADVDDTGSQETMRLIHEENGQAIYFKTNVSNHNECKALVDKALETYGRLDYACNNAGIGGEQNLTADYSVDGWEKVIAINQSGVFYCMKYEIAAMLKTGAGSIVNMASILGQVGFASSPAYVAAKHAVIGLTQNAAIEYGTQGIRVNAVCPGFIRTPLIADLESNRESMQALVSLHPIGRLGESEEVAELVIWLSSDKASFVTGSSYAVDGAYLAR